MKAIEDTPTRLVFTLGVPWFNGARCEFDKAAGSASIQTTNLFWKSKPQTIPIHDIVAVDLVVTSGPRTPGKPVATAAFPRLRLTTGAEISLPSFGTKAAEQAVEKLRTFLGA